MLLRYDIKNIVYPAMDKLHPEWMRWTEPRQRAIANMAFNLGYSRLKRFKKMWKAIRKEDWTEAARQAQDSKWYVQVGPRARRIVKVLQTGEDA